MRSIDVVLVVVAKGFSFFFREKNKKVNFQNIVCLRGFECHP